MTIEQDEFIPAAPLVVVWDENEEKCFSWNVGFEYLADACYDILLKLFDIWAKCLVSEVLITEITDYVLSYNCIMKGAMDSVILISWKLTKLSHRKNVHTVFEGSLRPAWSDAEEE